MDPTEPAPTPQAVSTLQLPGQGSRRVPWASATALLLCLGVAFGVYGTNLNDYFLGDDFDLIVSFYRAPPSYFFELLYSNESGTVWSNLGIDSAHGQGYLRPLKIWLLKLDLWAWGPRPLGFHLTATLLFGLLLFATCRLVDLAVPGRREFALLAAALVGIHPVFAEIVPFLTAREETLAALFVVAALVALLSHRQRGSSPLWFTLSLALGLMSKESAIVAVPLALGWDLVQGHLRPRRQQLRAALRLYGPALALLAVYFALRWKAFGNPLGGGGETTTFLSVSAFLGFHAVLLPSLVAPGMFALWRIPHVGWMLAALALLATVVAVGRSDPNRRRALLFFGPVWYLGATSILHGTYRSHRHDALIVVGLCSFAAVLLLALSDRLASRVRLGVAVAALAVAAPAFLPPTFWMARRFHEASRTVSDMRARIEAETARVPDGAVILIQGVPQQILPPYYFGWGLVSSLKRPFTATDVGNRTLVVNRHNRRMTKSRILVPKAYTLRLNLLKPPPAPSPPPD